jgi:hypothetical protein
LLSSSSPPFAIFTAPLLCFAAAIVAALDFAFVVAALVFVVVVAIVSVLVWYGAASLSC